MAHLVPFPLGRLAGRILSELEVQNGAVLDLPRSKVVLGPGALDWSTEFHGKKVASVLGPAAGPHTQLAQNIALAYLGGCRIFELKTVQILDEIAIPRPCIDVRTVGFNVEWSQELKLEESAQEYVKASMLLEVMAASGLLGLQKGFEPFAFDLSVGYDLKGIQHPRVRAFLATMMDATPIVNRLRKELPHRYRDLPFTTRLSDTLTLSTFHGCPPGEIEGIATFLMEEVGLHCVVKLNPTLNGPAEARRLFNDVLGYRARIPDSAFAADPTFEQAVELIGRLEGVSARSGRHLGVKFSNTLVVENEGDFLPKTEKLAYLSGQPLHVLAMHLVRRFRRAFDMRIPISFSAGIDRHNFADAVALGLVPVTVCTDLLRPGGYGRMSGFFEALTQRMQAVGVRTLEDFALCAFGQGEQAQGNVREAHRLNTEHYVATVANNPRYGAQANAKPPKKVGVKLHLFDCLTCDKCVPVCPNHANFTYTLPAVSLPVLKLKRTTDGRWQKAAAAPLVIGKKHQFANYADFCNECGNCDVFCPEEGGPYVVKPRFFGSEESWARAQTADGLLMLPQGGIRGRFGGQEFEVRGSRFSGEGFEVEVNEATVEASVPLTLSAGVEVDLTYYFILKWLRDAVAAAPVNYVNAPQSC